MKYAEKQKEPFSMYEISYTQNDLFGLISAIQFFPEPVDFLLVFADAVYLHTAQNHT